MASSPPAVPTAKTFQTAPIPSPDVSHDDIELTREVSRASGRKVAPQRLSDFELIRVLGKGCAGRVLLVKHAPTARVHAMKAISKRAVLANDELEHTLVEQRILHRFSKRERRSAFVSRLYYSFCDEENFYLVMEFYPGGDLATQMEIHGILGPLRTRFYACDIVAGLEALHREGILVRDLKPENILLNWHGHAVLADFGLSKSFGYRGDPIPVKIPADYIEGKGTPPEYAGRGFGSYRKDGDKWNLTWDRAFSFVGTQEYLAPEVIRRNHYTYAIDWWALGCIVCECLTGRVPFRGRDDESNAELYERVLVADWDAMYRGDHPRTYLKERYRIDSTTYDFIDGLLAKEPMFRLTEPCVKTHPYFTNVDWDTVEKGDYQDPSQLEIDPVAEYNTQFFPRLCLEETPTVDMSGHDYGKEPDDTKTALNSDEIYAKAQEQFREELKSFEWNCLWDEYESEYGEEEGEGEEAEEVEEVREEEVAEVAEAAEVREEENTADVHEDIHVDEAGDIEMEQEETETLAEELKPPSVRSAPSIRAPSVKSTKTASLRAPSIKTPSIKAPSVVLGSPRSPRSSVAPSLPQSDIPPVSPSDLGITTANVDNTTPRLPSGPPQSGLSVSDVISVPLRDSDSPNLIIRRHRPPTTADRFQNRLSVEINGIIGQLGDEDWEQLDMEADEIPEAVNGANESGQSSFLRGFLGRRQGGRLVSMRQRSTSTRPSSALRKAVTSESDEASRKKPQLSRGFESTKRALTRMAFPPSKRVGSNGSTYLWSNSPSPVASLRGTYASPVHPSGSASLRASVDDVAARSWASTLSPNGKRTARPDLSTPGFFSRSKRRGKLDVNAGSSGSGSASASTTTLESTPPATVTTTTTDGVPRLEVKASEPIVWDLPLSTSPTKR